MSPTSRSMRPHPTRAYLLTGILPAVLVALLAVPIASSLGGGHGVGPSHVSVPPSFHGSAPSQAAAAPAGHPAVSTVYAAAARPSDTIAFNPPCYPVDTGVCVSIQNPGETQIIPIGANRTASVMPPTSESLPLVIKSHKPLNYSGNTFNGPKTPIALNVTSVLWNGDPYYSVYDDSVWHSVSKTLWWSQLIGPGTAGQQNNNTYPWWYLVNITSKSATGQSNFFPGEQVTWWIELTYNTNNQSYLHHEGPHLQYTYSGAWPYSPYPGSPHFGGPAATFLDVNLTTNPRNPNWNDSVHVILNTTQADVSPYNATIGAAVLDLVEVSHGIVIANTSFVFNTTVSSGFGNTSTTLRIPASYAQVEGATVSYRISISDAAKPPDLVVTPWINYTIGTNGSFSTGAFTSDLTVQMNPSSVLLDPLGVANLTPGQPLHLTVISRNPTTAILSAEVLYSVAYPQLKETIQEAVFLHRITSIVWAGTIPGLPVDTIVNFTLLAWDFTDAVEQSDPYSYTVQTFDQFIPFVPPDLAFFYVYVYDNGSQNWVQGASVQISGPGNIYNSVSNTTLGVAYANTTGSPFTPLLVQANATYNVTVTDPYFVPAGSNVGGGEAISVKVVATNPMTAQKPLASTPNYIVLQEGNQILFYLNGTAPAQPASPSAAVGNPLGNLGIGAVLGLIGASVAMIPLRAWWSQIKARRTAEEKRVTL